MRALAIGHMDGDEKQGSKCDAIAKAQNIAIGMKNGWVCVFRADGQVVWTRRFESSVEAMAVHDNHLVIGFSDGVVRQVDSTGKTVRLAKFESGITVMLPIDDGIVVGTASGQLAWLP